MTGTQDQQGAQPAFVTAQQGVQIPFGPAQQGAQLPFGTAPQPYELYENALKNVIKFLQDLLSQSEAARTAAQTPADSEGDQQDQPDGAAQPTGFMPGFGCQQMPMPNQSAQQAPGIGVMPANNYIGSLFASLFGASNTDYFYED